MPAKKNRCENAAEHKGPFYSVEIVARQTGVGSRINDTQGRRRERKTLRLGVFCRSCMFDQAFRATGAAVLGLPLAV